MTLTAPKRKAVYLAIAEYITKAWDFNQTSLWICYLMADQFKEMTGLEGSSDDMETVANKFPEFGLFLLRDDGSYDDIPFGSCNFTYNDDGRYDGEEYTRANKARVIALLLCAEMCG
jgi:hypothetical protein